MTAGSFPRSHELHRLEPTRLRDVKARPSSAAPEPRVHPKRPNRAVRRSLLANTRAAAAKLVGSPGSEAGTPPEGAQVAQLALRSFRSAKRSIGTNDPIALAHLLNWALMSAAAQELTLAAAEAGLATDRGQRLLPQAQKCAGRAERSSTAAIVTAGLLGKPRKGTPDADMLAALVASASKPRGAP